MIRNATDADAQAMCDIYNHYIQTSIATFEEQDVVAEEMAKRVIEVKKTAPWYVFEHDGEVMGFAYASRWKGRCSYRYSMETTVYLSPTATGKSIGRQLYEALIDKLKEGGFHSAIGGISLPNPPSVALHEKLGYKKIAHFNEVGWKFDRWIDVGYWQLML